MIRICDDAFSMNGYFMVWRYVYGHWRLIGSDDKMFVDSRPSFNEFAEYNFGIIFNTIVNPASVDIDEEFYTYIILRNNYDRN